MILNAKRDTSRTSFDEAEMIEAKDFPANVHSVYSLADDCVHPGGVALRNLEASQSAGFDYEVIHTKLDILGFYFLQRGDQVER